MKKLRTWFEKIRKLDFYAASLGAQADERLARCEMLRDEFARQAFDVQDEKRAANGGRGGANHRT
ncbi:Chromate resistance protein ChrB [Mesorhizobium sp. B2-4-15]|uniref:Chromate resistance protein ChrB n=1 Tax=Mesorhizobium sp. B2-4-15 TaxID=2589934 RepID=UPI0032B23249